MGDVHATDQQIRAAAEAVGYRSGAVRYRARAEFLFSGIGLAEKHVLDVGCGSGAWAIWAGLNGAASVLGIEPEADGSSADMFSRFRDATCRLQLSDRVRCESMKLEELPAPENNYDIILLYNVINHIDEAGVSTMHRDRDSFARYVKAVAALKDRLRSRGVIIVADCGRSNLWGDIGLKSPVARSINWNIHQNPGTWTRVFREAGFDKIDLRWTPLHPLGALTANRVAQYLTCSHFCLRFRVAT